MSAAPRVLLLTDPAMARHAAPGHPERPDRLAPAAEGVALGARQGGATLERGAPTPAAAARLEGVHAPEYLAALDAFEETGGGWLDPDTYVVPGSMAAARLAAGAACEAAAAAHGGSAAVAFAVVRPPGHHAARRRAGGFCLVNNVAVAVTALERDGRASRIAILDWDVHHGDGTQELFDEHPSVLYASTHQRPLFPGTGDVEERGRGAARGTMHNVTLEPGSGDERFVSAWLSELLPAVEAFDPEAIVVSAGYDAHRDDPLAHVAVTEAGYRRVAQAVGELAAGHGIPGVAAVLEGGYDLAALRASVAATVEGLLDGLGGPPAS